MVVVTPVTSVRLGLLLCVCDTFAGNRNANVTRTHKGALALGGWFSLIKPQEPKDCHPGKEVTKMQAFKDVLTGWMVT